MAKLEIGKRIKLDGKEYLVVGKTFGSAERMKPLDRFTIESEQANIEETDAGPRLSLWVPEVIEPTDAAPDSLEAIVKRAREHGVLREKRRGEGGEVEYLPNDSGKPATAGKAVQEDEKQNILLTYPPESKTWRFVAQEHFRGKSAHLDLRFEAGDYLVGWTVPNQAPGTIKEPVTTLAAAKDALEDPDLWKMDMRTGVVKPRQIRGGTVRRGDLRAMPKGTEIPEAWLEVEGVTEGADPGEEPAVGATRNYPGVFAIVDRGTVEFGAQKPWVHEVFIHGKKWGDQRWLFRLLGRNEKGWRDLETGLEFEMTDEEYFTPAEIERARLLRQDLSEILAGVKQDVLPEGVEEPDAREGTYWVLMQPEDSTPYVLSPDAVSKEWLPPKGTSALPRAIRSKIPKELRYWEASGKRALERRRRIVEELDVRELAGTETKQAPEWRPYLLQRHWWRGPIQVRFGASEQHHDLRVKLNGKHWHLVIDGDPLTNDRLPAYEETKYSGSVTTADGKKINVMKIGKGEVELAPGQPANPTKDTPAWIETVDEGRARFLSDSPEFKKLEFEGGKLEGVWAFRLEEAGGEIGEFGREEAGPSVKDYPFASLPDEKLLSELETRLAQANYPLPLRVRRKL